MPEGPEVCITAQYLLSILNNKTIKYISNKNYKSIINYKIKDVNTKGKLLWFTLIKNNLTYYLICHFGLTGEWSFDKNEYNKLIILLNDDTKLYYNDLRNFGRMLLIKDKILLDKEINKLAPDFLKTEFTNDEFIEQFKKYMNKTIKRKNMLLVKVLMDQKAIGSGIGNYLSSEILYNAKLSPKRTLKSLSNNDLKKLSQSIKYIMKLSYYNNPTGYMTNFDKFILKHKKGIDNGKYPNYHQDIKLKKSDQFKFNVYRRKLDNNGNKVLADKINNNRTTYWIPNIQK